MQTLNLAIKGMHCSGCARTVEALLATEPGVYGCQVSSSDHSARVLYDPQQTSEAGLIKALERAGYGATGVGAGA
jgi:copper chaperone CopZ